MTLRLVLSVFVLCYSGIWMQGEAQQISETYRKVNPSVVVVRVQQKTPALNPQEGLVNLPSIGDSNKVEIGDEIFVIGSPYGLSHSLTVGHVSARRAAICAMSTTLYPPRCSKRSTATVIEPLVKWTFLPISLTIR